MDQASPPSSRGIIDARLGGGSGWIGLPHLALVSGICKGGHCRIRPSHLWYVIKRGIVGGPRQISPSHLSLVIYSEVGWAVRPSHLAVVGESKVGWAVGMAGAGQPTSI